MKLKEVEKVLYFESFIVIEPGLTSLKKGQLISEEALLKAQEEFGEDAQIDQLIRKYGYRTKAEILQLVEDNEDLAANPSAAAHLVHGSHENRFEVVYGAGKLSTQEIESVGYTAGDINQLMHRYDVNQLDDGWHTDVDGSEFYFIQNPALGLWQAPI